MNETILGVLAVITPIILTILSKEGHTRTIGAALLGSIEGTLGRRARRAVQLTLLDLAYGNPNTRKDIKDDIIKIEERIRISDTTRL